MSRGGRAAVALVVVALVLLIAGSIGPAVHNVQVGSTPRLAHPGRPRLTAAAAGTTVIADPDGPTRAVRVSRALFARSPGVALAVDGDTAGIAAAAAAAGRRHVPLLLLPAGTRPGAGAQAVRGEVERLGATWGAASGAAKSVRLPGLRRTPDGPPVGAATDGSLRTVLIADPSGADAPAAASARAAGATVVPMPSGVTDPTRPGTVVSALHRGRLGTTLVVGSRFGREPELAWKVRAAQSGWQLPGGGQRSIGDRRFVALYGAPGARVLGVLGHQGPEATVRRVQALAARYRPLSDRPVVPTLEIIATVAAGSPGSDGAYSNRLPASSLLPYIRAAERVHAAVILDLQPGRQDFLTQARHYRALLERPGVGLALDPEWRLGPHDRPLERIGSVQAAEVNRTSAWLARLVRDRGLPPKLFVLHQFRFSMLPDRERIVARPELDLAVHVDGQGTQPDKEATWHALHEDPPPGAGWGWKNFLVKDHPMLTPAETMRRVRPTPDLVTYQ